MTARTSVKGLVRRARSRVRLHGQDPDDPNFIGFDKYRNEGAYHWRHLDERPEYRRKVDLLAELQEDGSAVLDLGCGDGAYASVLAPGASEVVGIDADPDAVVLARKELRRAGITNVRCFQLPFGQVDLAGLDRAEPFDLVYSMDVIEHLPDPVELLTVAVACARPGARIVIGTPAYLGDELVSPYHVREFRPEELWDLLEQHMVLDERLLLPDFRSDGVVHGDAFLVGLGRRR